ncbi:HNH endonuclease [Limosilactobacillus reuteri]|uniref:HNH endonuclease n=1 Tax=Limosilactobacillus reuteri TaxID=1598 RepID=UPI001E400B04|nr:HNH endonuclease [Limosilactobacillus reuteri]MCC4501336.1 HNH endonuclease [Limosilactobacillus reuteri]
MPKFRRCRQPNCHAMVQCPDHYCKQHFEHEAEYLASRQRWARSHFGRYQHKYNHVTRNRNASKSDQYKFYHTKTWSTLRQQVLNRDHFVCQYCGRPNSKTVDHIVPVEYNPARKTDINNLAVICAQCHRQKTDWEQSHYGTGQGHNLKHVTEITSVSEIKRLMSSAD